MHNLSYKSSHNPNNLWRMLAFCKFQAYAIIFQVAHFAIVTSDWFINETHSPTHPHELHGGPNAQKACYMHLKSTQDSFWCLYITVVMPCWSTSLDLINIHFNFGRLISNYVINLLANHAAALLLISLKTFDSENIYDACHDETMTVKMAKWFCTKWRHASNSVHTVAIFMIWLENPSQSKRSREKWRSSD